ncbi:periplasmic heavy metal sensor [Tropicimonas sp. IMCC34011]|uniref:periplasmic heavy metal sensor n=1 Tax=Tropicimonas sp. IMCC34011 TaxID=2248759 RepID=UPI001300B5AE|nr:periplasmic heavy metal sensor [Tropicimonas sp. IMCC34011]
MADTPAPSRRVPIWLRALLILSLALNLLVGGIVIGAALKDRHRPARVEGELGLGPYLSAFGQRDREALRGAAAEGRAAFRADRREMRTTFAETIEALRADPFDPARLESLLARQGEIVDRGRKRGHAIMIERLSTMDAAERAAFADRLQQAIRRGPGRRGPPPGKRD